MPETPFIIESANFIGGYNADPRNREFNELSSPSQNVRITEDGEAFTRPGYEGTTVDLGEGENPSTSFYMQRFNITFYAVDTAVYYVDHNASDAVRDTGITLTTGTTTRFTEYAGFVILSNVTDGVYCIMVTRLNGAVSSGAATITTDIDGAARAQRFDTELSPGTKNLRIEGTDEQYASVNAATGVFTLSGTASQAYTDNTIGIVVYDTTAVFPLCTKVIPWQESLNCVGISADDTVLSSDVAPTIVAFSKFITAIQIENMVQFSGGNSGTEMVGKSGIVTNGLETRDYLYLFKEDQTFFVSVNDINTATGQRHPQILGDYGCVNADSAADMGNGEVAFITNDKRIMRIKTSTEDGAPVVFPDESFDVPMRSILNLMDANQTESLVWYHKGKRLLYCQISVQSEILTLVYDNNIRKWLPPDTNKVFKSYHEREGRLFATDRGNDTIYEIDLGLTDSGVDIECTMAHGIFESRDGRVTTDWQQTELSGGITQGGNVNVETIVDDSTVTSRTIDDTAVSFESAKPIGTVSIGSLVLGASATEQELGAWDKRYAIYPSYGQQYQTILSSLGEGHAFSWKSYLVRATALTESVLTLQ